MSRHPRGIFERPTGSGIYWIHWHDESGQRHREKVGPKQLAIAAYERRKSDVRSGKFFPELRLRSVQFDQLCTDFKKSYPKHWSKGMFTLCSAWFGSVPAVRITPQLIAERLNKLVEEGRSPATANRYRAILSAVFALAIRNGKATSNPARLVPLRREENSRIRFLSEVEEQVIRRAIRQLCPLREPEFDLALHTGMRRGEQYGLAWPDVDFQRRLITLSKTKNGKPRFVHLNTSALAAVTLLRKHNGQNNQVCASDGIWFKQVLRSVGVEHFRWHDLRHTFASRLCMAGVDLRTIQELMGHESIAMTVRYAHLSESHLQKAIEQIAGPAPTGLRIAARGEGQA